MVLIGESLYGEGIGECLLNFVYLHGNVRIENEFDLVDASCIADKEFIENQDELICDVTVKTYNGKNIPCTLFYWKDGAQCQHGLIVAKDDEPSNKYAKNHYERKSARL